MSEASISPTWANELRGLIPAARRRAAAVGSMSALWDPIFDAEALIEGRPTLLSGAPDEIAAVLIQHLAE